MSTSKSQPDLETLRKNFQRAITAWITAQFGDWQELWLGPECALLKYARAKHCDFDADDLGAFSRMEQHDHRWSANELYQDTEGETLDKEAGQAVLLMQGLVHGVLATVHLRTWKPGKEELSADFVRHAGQCIAAYQKAWPLSSVDVKPPAGVNQFQQADRIASALDELVGPQHKSSLTVSTWLTVHRLWSYLLSADSVPVVYVTEASVLLTDDTGGGAVGRLTIQSGTEGQFGCYLDPVYLGQTLVDRSMINCLQLAWSVCQPGLQKYVSEPSSAGPALRISPELPVVVQITGGSAGGLFACGMYAVARGMQLNTDASASFVLKRPENVQGEIDPAQISIGPVSSESLAAKLKAAGRRIPALGNVILEKEQAEEFQQTGESLGVSVHGVSNLAEAFHLLTGDAHQEQILRQYSDAVWDDWQELRQGRPPTGNEEDHKLDFFIEPHVALLEEGNATDTSQMEREANQELSTNRYHRVLGVGEEGLFNLLDAQMLHEDRWLCFTEDAGAGKTVFTLWLLAFLSSPQWRLSQDDYRSWLVVRCEHGWPRDLKQTLAEHLLARCPDLNPQEVTNVVEYALKNRRVVLILDSLDQASDNDVSALEDLLSNEVTQRQIRLVLTSRAHAAREWESTLLAAARWKKARIELFDESQQDAYLHKLNSDAVRELIPNRNLVSELTKFPVVLRLVRQLIEERIPGQPLHPFRLRGDLYWQTSNQLLQRAFKKSGRRCESEQLDVLRDVLSCIAFEMTICGLYNYSVPAGEIRSVKRSARDRSTADHGEWQWAMGILKDTHLTDRCILEGNDDQHLSFRSRKMMEFFAGLHLARYAQVESQTDAASHTNDGEWEWTWRFAIETPLMTGQTGRQTFRGDVLCGSLAQLFARPQSGPRPNDLMYLAWHLFEEDEFTPEESRGQVLPGAESVVREFRQQFQAYLDQKHPAALQLVPQNNAEQLPSETRPFVRCPPLGANIDRKPFWMGSTDNYGSPDERPIHRVVLDPFTMQSTPVTRAQYSLYDPDHGQSNSAEMNQYAPSDDCPVLFVSWYDAVMFTRCVGGRLPTEAEWEYACRAGGESKFCFGDDISQLMYYGWCRENSDARTHPVGQLKPNAWGLYDMHGNVWEWCHDRYDSDYYDSPATETPMVNPSGPRDGLSRVLRGGGWYFCAALCNSARRDSSKPDYRGHRSFRVVR